MPGFRDLKIDNATGDLVFQDGDLDMVEDADAIGQEVAVLLRTLRGEWFADLDEGVPYLPDLLQSKPTDAQIEDAIRQAVGSVGGVAEIRGVTIVRADRVATATVEALTVEGGVVTVSVDMGA